ncbi:putative oxidoreductase GLYR1 homolog [Trichonephila clavipes]|nr:putative oxidoreductase GLYR1 homolog [Trichonephila clavipes]
MSDDHPSLISSTPYNANPHVSVIRRFRVDRQYYELPPLPTLNFKGFKYPEIKRKPIKTSKRIGFIGIGMMGQRLVRNLLVTGHDVSVWNRTPDKCKECVSAGAQQLLTPADIVWSCDVIFCCVSGPEAAKSCMYETWGIKHGFEKSEPGSKVYIELTSMDPDTSQEMCAVITDRGGKYLEAPLRGSRSLAEDGLLLALVAGDEMCFKENLPYFSVMCKNAYYVSSNVGDASKMNLALSSLTGTTYASAAEAMTLMECAQIPMNNSVDLCGLNGMKSASLRERCLAISSQDFITEGTLKYQQENMFMALALGSKYNISMGLTATAHEIYKHATLLRYSDHDVSAVYCGAKY